MTRFSFKPSVSSGWDAAIQDTYAGVGRVLSSWEGVEFELSRLFAALMEQPDVVMGFYGTGKIFGERLNYVKIAAAEHFKKKPNQDHEGDFNELLEDLLLAADRRNEVAHGMVLPVTTAPKFLAMPPNPNNEPRHLLLPPAYSDKRFAKGLPKFAYSSNELIELAKELFRLQGRVRPFRHRLYPNLWRSERRGPWNVTCRA